MGLPNETQDPPRREIWLRWLPELFGDAYAVAALGAAFVLGLSAYLSDQREAVRAEKLANEHPPAFLRIKLNCALLKELGLSDEGVGSAWDATYKPRDEPYVQDAPVIAETLLRTALPKFDATLPEVLAPPAITDQFVDKIRKVNAALPDNPDFRLLVAGASLLFHRSPADYASASTGGALTRRFAAKIRVGTRGKTLSQAEMNRQAAADRAAGHKLFSALMGEETPGED
jgi:hypothetical protein